MTGKARAAFQCVARRAGELEPVVLAAGALPDVRDFYERLGETAPDMPALLVRDREAIIAKRGSWRGIAYKLLMGK